jgi:hypothetical protein
VLLGVRCRVVVELEVFGRAILLVEVVANEWIHGVNILNALVYKFIYLFLYYLDC